MIDIERITDQLIMYNSEMSDLAQRVTSALKIGWVPFGPAGRTNNGWHQTFVKLKPKETQPRKL